MLNVIRNICVHHDCLWSRRLGNRPKIPRGNRYPDWHRPHEVDNSTAFTLLTILSHLLVRIAPNTSWHDKVLQFLQSREEEDLRRMGFEEGWEACPMWARFASRAR